MDFNDSLVIGYPETNSKEKNKIDRENLFYYLNLAPIARQSISEV